MQPPTAPHSPPPPREGPGAGSLGSKCTSTMARTESPGPRSRRRTLQKSFLTSEFRNRSSSCGGEGGSRGCPGRPSAPPPQRFSGSGREETAAPHPTPRTHRTLDAPGCLPKQLGLGVGHLRRVEQLLPLDPLELQHTLERPGGCGGGRSEALPGTVRPPGRPRARPQQQATRYRQVAISQMVMRLVGAGVGGWQLPGKLRGQHPGRHATGETGYHGVLGTHVCAGSRTSRVCECAESPRPCTRVC